MDGISSLETSNTEGGVLVLAACSDIDAIDEGLLRPGRFQYHIGLDPPSPNDVRDILERHLSKMNKSSDISVPYKYNETSIIRFIWYSMLIALLHIK